MTHHRDERDDATATGHTRCRSVRPPDEPAADRAADPFELVAGLGHIRQVGRHLAVVEPLDEEFDKRVGGGRGN